MGNPCSNPTNEKSDNSYHSFTPKAPISNYSENYVNLTLHEVAYKEKMLHEFD